MHNRTRYSLAFVILIGALLLTRALLAQTDAIGIFENHSDVGDTPKHGDAAYDRATGEYRVTGGGVNIWFTTDAFQYVWKKISGDATLSASVRFEGAGAVPHRKAVLMFRQSLAPNSAYADVALHGDGLTALQYRPSAGTDTQELRSTVNAPARISISRHGDQFTMSTGNDPQHLSSSEPITVHLSDPLYVGIGVSSHDANVLETAIFSDVTLEAAPQQAANPTQPANPTNVRSKITIFDVTDKSTHVVYTDDTLWEAPNWSPDGKYLLANSGGQLYRFPLNGYSPAHPEKLALGADYRCNNDHGISRDGKWLALSATYASSHASQVFVAAADGTQPHLLTPQSPSYFHGWSPDGKWLAFVGERDHNFDIYRVAAAGSQEERLTSDAGYDDGPDYSPDGKWIYLNSNRSGTWDIWRIPAEGAGPDDHNAERITSDELEDWFPHPSPDGKWLLFLSFPKGTPGHDAKTNIQLRMMPLPSAAPKASPDTKSIQVVTGFFGGQGTINVNSWAPDSKRFAFVNYEVLPAKGK